MKHNITCSMLLALGIAHSASAASMMSGYSVGSGLLSPNGETLFLDYAATGGNNDLRDADGFSQHQTYLVPGAGSWNIGDTVEITGCAFTLVGVGTAGWTDYGTMTFDVRQGSGGSGTSGAGGLASLGTATATLASPSSGTGVYYVNFDTPVSFVADANSLNIGINVANSSAIWLKAQSGFPVTRYDYVGGSAWSSAKVSVAGNVTISAVPVAIPQSKSLDKNSSVGITLTGTGGNGVQLAFEVLSGPTHGQLTGTAPSVLYEPNTDYIGADSFTFRVSDGESDSEPATVSLNILDPTSIESFSASPAVAQGSDPAVLLWEVTGTVSTLEITPDVGDVAGLTTNGAGSVEVHPPLGMKTYTLTLNGEHSSEVSVASLPGKQKLNIYLLIGQSNMQGEGKWFNASQDSPHPRVLKFGSREGMETVFAEGSHKLYNLNSATGGDIGMGVEFGKTMIAAQSDPEVMLCLINHAYGNTAIDWWMPGVPHPTATRSNGQSYYLYDEAVQRVHDAENYGVLKGVLWHQGEWNSSPSNDPQPEGYLAHLEDLVDNLRTEFNNPSLPFICGKLVPSEWVDGSGTTIYYTGGANRHIVEAAMDDLLNHRNNTFCVDNAGLRGHNDEMVHFDAYSQRLLGQRYAAAMLNCYSDPYLLYLGGYLTPVQMADPLLTDPLWDNDGDGRINYLEYALRFNPMVADYSSPLTISVLAQTPTVSFNKRTDTEAPVYGVDFSTNLVDWVSNAVVEVEGSPLDHGDGSAKVTLQSLTNTPNAFFRIWIE